MKRKAIRTRAHCEDRESHFSPAAARALLAGGTAHEPRKRQVIEEIVLGLEGKLLLCRHLALMDKLLLNELPGPRAQTARNAQDAPGVGEAGSQHRPPRTRTGRTSLISEVIVYSAQRASPRYARAVGRNQSSATGGCGTAPSDPRGSKRTAQSAWGVPLAVGGCAHPLRQPRPLKPPRRQPPQPAWTDRQHRLGLGQDQDRCVRWERQALEGQLVLDGLGFHHLVERLKVGES